MYENEKKVSQLPVEIGNHVWIAAFVDILKGVNIPSDSVVAYRSCVTKPFFNEHSLIAGYPAKQIKEQVNWNI